MDSKSQIKLCVACSISSHEQRKEARENVFSIGQGGGVGRMGVAGQEVSSGSRVLDSK